MSIISVVSCTFQQQKVSHFVGSNQSGSRQRWTKRAHSILSRHFKPLRRHALLTDYSIDKARQTCTALPIVSSLLLFLPHYNEYVVEMRRNRGHIKHLFALHEDDHHNIVSDVALLRQLVEGKTICSLCGTSCSA